MHDRSRTGTRRAAPAALPPVAAVLAVAALGAAACGGAEPESSLEKIASAAATARLARAEWEARHVSTRYAEGVVASSREAVEKHASAVDPTKLTAGDRARVANAIDAARRDVADAEAVVR